MKGMEDEFRELYAARAAALRRTAFLLCGDWHAAEDLVQVSFAKLYAAWR
ncbi:MAG: SigE family RNA polymerase sigma factor, partial [Catenulisporales bacterium]|nr:SigE family RNA polymerase sigma factor [Catenulisporales bacterium]